MIQAVAAESGSGAHASTDAAGKAKTRRDADRGHHYK